ncbi:MAG: hypothetical protein U5L46_09730 [Agrobacterium sp.]|nr:hypothetical protein [Agrobacterium sp.]
MQQLNGLLADARGSLQKVDAVLVEAQGIASNTREATTDLGTLRAEVEASLRKVDRLVNEINRKWPFARETDIRLSHEHFSYRLVLSVAWRFVRLLQQPARPPSGR